jgi:hypothetical protein
MSNKNNADEQCVPTCVDGGFFNVNRGKEEDDDCVRNGYYLHYPSIPHDIVYGGAEFEYRLALCCGNSQNEDSKQDSKQDSEQDSKQDSKHDSEQDSEHDSEQDSEQDSNQYDDSDSDVDRMQHTRSLVITLVTNVRKNEYTARYKKRFKIDIHNLPRQFRDEFLDFQDNSVIVSHRFWFDLSDIVTSNKNGIFCDGLINALDAHVIGDGELCRRYTGGYYCCGKNYNMTELDNNPYMITELCDGSREIELYNNSQGSDIEPVCVCM